MKPIMLYCEHCHADNCRPQAIAMRAILKLPRSALANPPANMGVMQQLLRFLLLRDQ